MNTTPVISVHDVKLVPRPEAWLPRGAAADKFECQRAFVGEPLGLKKIGCNVTQVAPGCTGYPFHSHRANDELFYILSGRGELRLGQVRHPVKEGDLIGCPTGGPETAHQLINTGSEPLRYLAISSQFDPDICEYPDSGKIGTYCNGHDGDPKTGLMHLSKYSSHVDYWDGE